MRRTKLGRLGTTVLGVLLIGLTLQALGEWKGDSLVFPGVGVILRAFFGLLGQGRTWLLIWTTIRHLLEAVALASVVGLAIGLVEGLSDFSHRLLAPWMTLLRSIPMVVLVIIIMVLTKYERVPLLATTLILTPLISEAACEGCRAIPQELVDVYRMNSRLNLRVIRLVYLPMMRGYLRQAYISAVGMGVKMVVSTEYLVQAKNSLGKAIHNSVYFNEYQDIYAYALLMILLVLLLGEAPGWLSHLAERRKAAGEREECPKAERG